MCQLIRKAELFLPQCPFTQNGLYIPGPVPKREKLQFAARSMMPDPSLETNLPPHHFSNMRDRHDWDTHTSVYAFIGPEAVTKTENPVLQERVALPHLPSPYKGEETDNPLLARLPSSPSFCQ